MKIKAALVIVIAVVYSGLSLQAQTCQTCTIGPASRLDIQGCTDDSTTYSLNVTNSTPSTVFYVRNDRRVGINHTSPQNTLHVYTPSGNGGINLQTSSANPEISYLINSNTTSTFRMGVDYSDANKFKIGTSALGTNTRFTIDASGNTGIGVTSPTAVLHLKAGTSSSAPFKLTSGTNLTTPEAGSIEYDGTRLYYTTSTPSRITLLGNNLGLSGGTTLIGGTSNSENLTLQSTSASTKGKIIIGTSAYDEQNNRLGIGTTTPGTPLDVNGTAKMTGFQLGTSTTSGYVLTANASGVGTWQSLPSTSGLWSITGNSGTTAGTNFIGTTDGVDLVIKTNSSERMRVVGGATNTGNVGIGSTAPPSLFTVGATNQFQVNSSGDMVKIKNITYSWPSSQAAGSNYVLTNNGSGTLSWAQASAISNAWGLTGNSGTTPGTDYIGTSDAQDLVFKTNGGERFRVIGGVTNTGFMGIGTNSPSTLLDVETTNASAGIDINNAAAGDGDPRLSFQLSGTSVFAMGVDDSDGDKFKIGTTAIDASTRFTIDGSGNIGMGTTSPSTLLDIESTASSAGLDINNTATDGDPRVSFQLSGTSLFAMGVDDSDGDKFKIGTTAIDASTRMTIDGSGFVGFGSSSPTTELQVGTGITKAGMGKAGAASPYFYQSYIGMNGLRSGSNWLFDSDGANNGGGVILTNAVGEIQIAPVGNSGTPSSSQSLTDANLNGKVMVFINSTGLGVGKSPGAQLELSLNSAVKPSSSTWTIASDERLKKDITPFNDGLSVVKQISPVNYKYNGLAGTPNDNAVQIGILAQDMLPVAPYTIKSTLIELTGNEAALFPGNKTFLRNEVDAAGNTVPVYQAESYQFDAHALFFVLINAVKELDSTNTQLTEQIQTMNSQIQTLQQQVAQLQGGGN